MLMETPIPEISLQYTLRPANEYGIWTGGANGTMESVKSTSILGGLRFWTGALLRANGFDVCEDRNCIYEEGKSICSLCKIFGCTGLSRVCNLSVDASQKLFQPITKSKKYTELTNHRRTTDGKSPRYYFTQAYQCPITITISLHRPLLEGTFAIPREITTALYLMITYGTLGAYDQDGCGLMDWKDPHEAEHLKSLCLPKANPGKAACGISLRDFFFYKGQIQGDGKQAMAEIRYRIRDALRSPFSQELRHWFCGSLGNRARKEEASGCNYTLTIDSKGYMYGWGFYPTASNLPYQKFVKDRETVLDRVKKVLSDSDMAGNSLVWRECNSKRDTKGISEWPQWYADLLQSPWRMA